MGALVLLRIERQLEVVSRRHLQKMCLLTMLLIDDVSTTGERQKQRRKAALFVATGQQQAHVLTRL